MTWQVFWDAEQNDLAEETKQGPELDQVIVQHGPF